MNELIQRGGGGAKAVEERRVRVMVREGCRKRGEEEG
jgi:hypothetical protein